MEELLQKLLEAEVLSEDTKKELEEAFQKKLDEAITAAKDDATADVKAELTSQWVEERDALVEAVDAKVTEFLTKEVEELKEDIERFRDLEAEYAEKLVESKASMSDELKDDLMELVEKVDAFLEIRINAEIEELRDDLKVVQENNFGATVFEAFKNEYIANYADAESAESTLRETTERLNDMQEALVESESKLADMTRAAKMEEILAHLVGRQKEVMEAILRNVDTENLEEGYKTFIGRVLRETDVSEKEGSVLAEGKEEDDDCDDDDKKSKKSKKFMKDVDDKKDKKDKDKKITEGNIVTGNTDDMVLIEEGDSESQKRIEKIQRLAGIIN